MRRTRLRALGRRCQAGHSADHAGVEDQVIEDQQESLQGARSFEGQLALSADSRPRFREDFVRHSSIDDVRQFREPSTSLISVTSAWRSTYLLVGTERNAKNSQEGERGRGLYPKRPDRQGEYRRVGNSHWRGRE